MTSDTIQAVFLIGDVLFTFTGSTTESHRDTYIPLFDVMIDSFRVAAPEGAEE